MKRTSHLQGGLWRVPQQWFPEWGSRLIKDSNIVVRRDCDPYSNHCDSVGFIDLIHRFDFFFNEKTSFIVFKALCSGCRWSPAILVPDCLPQPTEFGHQHTKPLGWLCFATGTDNFLFQLTYNDLALQVPDLDAGPVAAEPVAVGTEAPGTHDVPTI